MIVLILNLLNIVRPAKYMMDMALLVVIFLLIILNKLHKNSFQPGSGGTSL